MKRHIAVSIVFVIIQGCGHRSTDSDRGPLTNGEDSVDCTYDGKVYQLDDTFADVAGCNTCTCTEDGVSCTKMACPPAKGECDHAGNVYQVGETFPAEDGCNTCSCTKEGVSCTEMACPPAKGECDYAGNVYQVGETFPAEDGCNTCSCAENGVGCTKMECQPIGCELEIVLQCPKGQVDGCLVGATKIHVCISEPQGNGCELKYLMKCPEGQIDGCLLDTPTDVHVCVEEKLP